MTEKSKRIDRAGLAIGGTTLIGLDTGFIFPQRSPLLFVACLLIGVGAGLSTAVWIARSGSDSLGEPDERSNEQPAP